MVVCRSTVHNVPPERTSARSLVGAASRMNHATPEIRAMAKPSQASCSSRARRAAPPSLCVRRSVGPATAAPKMRVPASASVATKCTARIKISGSTTPFLRGCCRQPNSEDRYRGPPRDPPREWLPTPHACIMRSMTLNTQKLLEQVASLSQEDQEEVAEYVREI